jgi:hypothetical protein
MENGDHLRTFTTHKASVTAICVSATTDSGPVQGGRFVSGGGRYLSVFFHSYLLTVVSCRECGALVSWDIATGKTKWKQPAAHGVLKSGYEVGMTDMKMFALDMLLATCSEYEALLPESCEV